MGVAETGSLPGSRRAAILMVLLGPEVAGLLLKQLPQQAAGEIIAEVAGLGVIEPDTAEAVLDEYVIDAVRPERHRGGDELARKLLGHAEIPRERHAGILGIEEDPARELLGPLLESAPAVLSSALAGEHRQTAALVLLHLSPRKAAQVLGGLPEEARAEVVRRMTGLRAVRGEILQEVVDSLGTRLRDSPAAAAGNAEADGLERTAEVLQSMARGAVRELLDGLEHESPDEAAKLREMVFTFDSLILADDRGIQELLRAVETKTLALALHGTEDELSDKFMSNLSERAAGMLREEIEFLGTIRPADQQAAQQEITQKALELEQEEKLVFMDPGAEGDG